MTTNSHTSELITLGDYSLSGQRGKSKMLVLAFAGIGSLLPDRTEGYFRESLERSS